MLNSHERFFSVNGKRRILVVDDEAVNREMLRMILEDRYELLFAENGGEALTLMRDNAQLLSLVLLDLMMPVMNGFEVLDAVRSDDVLRRIPIIVLTSEKAAEVKSLEHGAQDFITKPYELPEVILARIRRIIELSEDSAIIQKTERDELTGLLNSEYFYRYVEQYDLHHPGQSMNAIVLNINHFHMVNELHGRAAGDALLKRVGTSLIDVIGRNGGIAGRKAGDEFLLYLPDTVDPDAIHIALSDVAVGSGRMTARLRMGVYADGDTSLEVERRFDRAKQAGDTLRSNYQKFIAFYDNALHEKALLNERLTNEFDAALKEGQFKVYYQPKYAVQGDKPVLTSAEALVRWDHPALGTVSPGVFISLFEQNGLIQRLDRYVWTAAAEQIRAWRDAFGVTLPVSVNVSRIDMYASDFIPFLAALTERCGLRPNDLYLEITESAYTENSKQLMETICALRELGFYIEMDDFGSGYSSLNMLSTIPIDALKLDMHFVRNMETDERSVRMLELIIDIADYFHVPAIAEGVETESQMLTLKKLGCAIIQGYYFSKPVPPERFEAFIRERRPSC